MARGNFMQNSFLSGEWSPFSQGRTDEEAYYAALNLSLNCVVSDTGALQRRSGTRFSAHAKTHTGLINLIEFVSETSDALVVELTDLIARFHQRGELLVDASAPKVVSISAATPAVVETDVAHGWSTGNTVVFRELAVKEAAPLFNRQFTITVLWGTTFSIAHTAPLSGSVDGSTLVGAAVSPLEVARVTERAMPYTAAQVGAVKHTEEENTLYLFHPAHEIRTVDRSGLVVTEQELLDGPYLDQNETATTLTFSGVSGSVTVTASAITGINNGTGFQTTDIGRALRINTGTEEAPAWSWLDITARASTTVVTATVRGANLASAAANTKWRLGVYSDTTTQPVHGVIHEGRLWLIGPSGRIDGSKTFDFFNFEPTAADGTVADDNAASAVFAGSGRQTPRWLQAVEIGLLIGTDGGEYIVRASSFDDPITPFSLQVRRQSAYGAADVLPVMAGQNSVFVQSLGRSVYEYRFGGNGIRNSLDLARDARHLTSNGIVDMAYVSEPVPALWCLRGDNRLVAATYRFDDADEQRIIAWHRHSVEYDADVTAGEDTQVGTAIPYLRGGQSQSTGNVYSIAAIPFSDPEASRNDLVWMAVKRGTVVCIEYMTPVFDETFLDNEQFFVDSGNIYRQEDLGITWEQTVETPPTFAFHGLDRLEGKTVDVAFRGVDLGTAVVTSGTVTAELPVELDGTASAYETTTATEAIGGTLTFSSGFVSNIEDDVIVQEIKFSPQHAFCAGEDGHLYYTALHASVDPAGIYIVNAADGTLAISRNETTVRTDLSTDGAVPPGGWVNGAGPSVHEFAMTLPGSPYILMHLTSEFGIDVNHGTAYYKVNNLGALEYIGAIAEDPTGTSFQFVPSTRGGTGEPPKGVGYLNTSLLSGQTIFKNSPTLLAEWTESKSLIVHRPSVGFIESNTPVNVLAAGNIEARALNITTGFPTFDKLFAPHDAESPINNALGFFLPGPPGVTYAFSYIGKNRMEAHAAGTAVNPIPAVTTQSAISTDPVMACLKLTGDETEVRGLTADLLGGAMFDNFPFSDIGEKFDATAGTNLNDYGSASVFPSDPSDHRKPWYVFFPRVYPDGTDSVDKFGIRAYLWEPRGGFDGLGKATHLSFAKGKLYDVTLDGLPATQSLLGSVSIYWDRTDNTLYVISNGTNFVATDTVVSVFGTFTPTTGQITTVDASHIDATIGCNYRSRFQLLRPDAGAGAQNGPALAKKRRIDQFGLLTYRSGGLFIGTDGFDNLLPTVLVQPDDLGRRPLFTGVHENTLQGDYNFDNMISGEYRRPVAGAITAISGFSTTSDR